MKLQNKHDTDDRWIFERNPDTGELFRRKYGDYDSPRELIKNTIKETIDYEAAAINLKGTTWMAFIDSLTDEQKIQLSRCWD